MLHSKKKYHEKIISLLLLLTVSISCTDGFEEINTNKNQPTASQAVAS
jgi:hypothetical protein